MSSLKAGVAVQLLVAALAAAVPSVALAALSLTTTAAPTFSDNLDLGDQTTSYSAALTAKDTSIAISPGWHLTITSTQFTTGGGSPHTLATTASSITSVSSVCAAGSCVNPTNSVTYPVAVPAASSPPTAVTFYNAAANTGQGTFTVTPTIRVTVPQNSYAGTYTSTLTLAIASGP
jgi:hypothetical protein